jgi:hypothetical protein
MKLEQRSKVPWKGMAASRPSQTTMVCHLEHGMHGVADVDWYLCLRSEGHSLSLSRASTHVQTSVQVHGEPPEGILDWLTAVNNCQGMAVSITNDDMGSVEFLNSSRQLRIVPMV